jgi:MoaA/NifB/PqqE/SkfB family radical SAM enzyme
MINQPSSLQRAESCRAEAHRTCRFRPIQGGGFRLAVEVTRRCNSKCLHCFVPHQTDEPGTDELIRVLKEATGAGCRKIILTGGEPLLRPDLESIAAACASRGALVDMNSNLLGLDEERARRLQEAGVREVSASLHGDRSSHDWLSGRAGNYAEAVRGIGMLRGLGVPVDVHSAIWDASLPSLPGLARLCTDLGVASLTLFRILPTPHRCCPREALALTPQRALADIEACRAETAIPIRTVGVVPPQLGECQMGESILGVDATLGLSLCLLAQSPNGGAPLSRIGFVAAWEQLRQERPTWVPACVPAMDAGEVLST